MGDNENHSQLGGSTYVLVEKPVENLGSTYVPVEKPVENSVIIRNIKMSINTHDFWGGSTIIGYG